MPISEQVLRDLRDIVRANRGEAMSDAGQRLVFRVLPSLLDEVESLRDRTLQKDFVALYQSARYLTAWLREHEPMLPPETAYRVEGLAEQVTRLAPLHDDARANLNVELARRAWPVDPAHSVRVLQSDGTGRVECDHTFKGTTRCVHCGKPIDELRAEVRAEALAAVGEMSLGERPEAERALRAGGYNALADLVRDGTPETVAEAARRHGLEFLPDGSARLLDPPDLRLPSLLPDGVLHATPDDLADIVQRQLDEHEARGIINREALDRTIASARIVHDEGAPADEVRLTFTAPPMHEAFSNLGVISIDPGGRDLTVSLTMPGQGSPLELPDDEVAVPITLGPSLLPRVEALVATGRLGSELEHVVQTLFVLGMLDAEGQDPQAHVGAPHSHVSAEALFVRFGLPHEGGERATRQRASILRQLLLDLSEWCDEGDPLRPAFAAAIEALPR